MRVIRENLSSGFSLENRLVMPQEGKIITSSGEFILEPKLMELLVFFAENEGKTLTRQEIFDEVWSDSFVTEAALYKSISNLRRMIEDDPQNPRIISTVPKRGYRLEVKVGPIPHPDPPAQSLFRRSFLLIGLLVAVPLLIFLGWRFLPTDSPDVAQRDGPTVLLSKLQNRTGEDLLEGTLDVVLEGRLNDSGRLRLVSRPRIDHALELMRQPVSTPVSEEVARQISLRDGGIDLLLSGRIDRLGGLYQVSLRLIDGVSHTLLASSDRQTDSLESLIPAVDGLSSWLLEELDAGSSATDQPLPERVTTKSLEALRLYTRAIERYNSRDYSTAIALNEDAVDIDPEFASAYLSLAFSRLLADNLDPSRLDSVEVIAKKWLGGRELVLSRPAWSAMEKTMQLKHLTSFVERSFIQGCYYDWQSEHAKAAAFYKLTADLQPEHRWAGNNLIWSGVALKDPDVYADGLVAQARARPYLLATQLTIAGSLVDHGYVERAAEAIDRIRSATAELTAQNLSADFELSTAWLWAFDVWSLWLKEDYAEFRRATDRLAQKIRQWRTEGASMQRHAYFLTPLYLLQGRLGEAEQSAQEFDLRADSPTVSSPYALLAFLSESAAPLGPPMPEQWAGLALRPVARILFDPAFVSNYGSEDDPENWHPSTRSLVPILVNRKTRTPGLCKNRRPELKRESKVAQIGRSKVRQADFRGISVDEPCGVGGGVNFRRSWA